MSRFLVIFALVLACFAAPVSANPITTASFGAGTAFWNGVSYDRLIEGGSSNIGNFIRKDGGSTIPNFYANAPNLGAAWLGDGGATFLFDLLLSPEPSMTVSHLFSVTGWNDGFGLYDPATGAHMSLGYAHTQQYGSVPTVTSVFASGLWGFYLRSGEGNTWYSGSASYDGRSHFALFQGENPYTWYLGIEDATYNTPKPADWDYNDVILKIEVPQPVPEPGGMSLLGIGLLAIARAAKKWKVRQ